MRPKRRGLPKVAGFCLAMLVASLLQMDRAPAQSETAAPATELPHLQLTDAQRETIYTSVVKQNFRNATPPNFQPRIGAVVPVEVELADMPKTILELMPDTKPFQLARIVNQVVIVDPNSRRVVEVISAKQP